MFRTITANKKINSGTGVTDYLRTKFTSGEEDENYFKIEQVNTGKAAAITNTLDNTTLDGATEANSIYPDNLANNFNADSDGLIYYTNISSVKVYDLAKDLGVELELVPTDLSLIHI